MKRLVFAAVVALVLGFTPSAHAALVDNGGNLIYDTNLNITWYDPVPTGMTWGQATAWAAGLTVGGTTAGSWTLPTTPGTTTGYTNEGQMGYLYYNELGNGADPYNLGYNKGPFTNLVSNPQPPQSFAPANAYWTNVVYDPSNGTVWLFLFAYGAQYGGNQFSGIGAIYELAVHSGDVGAPVPIPGAILLFAPGLLGLALVRRRFKK